MKPIKDITRGGQIGYHFLSMFWQVNAKLKYAALIIALAIGCLFIRAMPKIYFLDTLNYYHASAVYAVFGKIAKKPLQIVYFNEYGSKQKVYADNVISSWSVKRNKDAFFQYLTKLVGSVWVVLSCYMWW